MTRYLIYAEAANRSIESANSTYSTARSGGTLVVNGVASYFTVGQMLVGGQHRCFESFFSFDTSSIPTTGVVIALADLSLSIKSANSTSNTEQINVRSVDWGTAVETTDWIAGASVAALPLRASYAAGIPYAANATARTTSFDFAGVVAGGVTRLVATTAPFEAGTASTTTQAYALVGSATNTTTFETKPVLRVNTVALSTLTGVQHASAQMPGPVKVGEPAVVSIRSNGLGSPTLTLGYSTLNSTTFTSIATLSAAEFDITAGQSVQNIALTVAPNGDIFVVGSRVGVAWGIAVKAFVKSGTATWTAKASIYTAVPGATGSVDWFSFAIAYVPDPVTDCIFVLAASPASNTATGWATLDVANARAGAGSSLINSGQAPPWLTAKWTSATQDDVLSVSANNGKVHVVSSYDHNVLTVSAGAITGSGTKYAVSSNSTKVQSLDLGADKYLKVQNWSDGRLVIVPRTSASGTSPVFPLAGAVFQGGAAGDQWTAAYDVRAGLVRIYIAAAAARTVSRYEYNPVTNTTSAATVITSTIGSVGSVVQGLRTVENTLDERVVMVEVAVNTAGVLSTVVLLDTVGQVVPNAPILTIQNPFVFTNPATFAWTFSDPNTQDAQSAYQLQIQRVSDSVDVVDTGKIVSATPSRTVAGSTLANNTAYRWRVRTYDALDQVGAYSAYGTFSTTDVPVVVITTPATDNIPTDSDTAVIAWSFTSSSGSTQTQRRVRVLRNSDSVVLSDTTMQASTSQTYTVTGLLSDVEQRIEVSTVSSTAQTSFSLGRLITPSYSSALAPVLTVTAEPGAEYLTLTVSNPESGSRPVVTGNEVWKREAGTVEWRQVATGVENDGTYRDYAVAQGQAYDYFVRAVS